MEGANLEILDTIFSFCEEEDAARAARVCKNWLDVALDHAWYSMDVEGFTYLCAILAPLRFVPEETLSAANPLRHMVSTFKYLWLLRMVADVLQEFIRPITHNDWGRFLLYARRVRVMDIIASPFEDPTLAVYCPGRH